jgi:tetratricopeptide (TPR) repeat protein
VDELDDALYARVKLLAAQGDQKLETGHYEAAIETFEEALTLLPPPPHKWEAATWLFVAVGDAAFQAQNYERAREALREAILCPGAIGNPFVHLRRGQVFFELNDLSAAGEELTGAYMLEGSAIFEQEDPKYFAYLKTILRPPASGRR